MALRLRVISEHRPPAGSDTMTFGVEGGSIGRSTDNDWVLPDARRYVSAHHARVNFQDGHYYLQDISTNGVYVNDEAEPLAKRESNHYRLREGDVLRIGEYRISVCLQDAPAGDSAVMPSSIMAVHPVGPAQTDIGAVLDLDDLLAVDPTGGAFGTAETESAPAGPASHESAAAAPRGTSAHSSPGPASQAPSSAPRTRPADQSDETAARRMARLARLSGHEGEERGLSRHDPALRAFCRGAGIKPEPLAAQTQGLLHLAGQLLREALVGLKDVERAHGQLRAQFGIPLAPPEPGAGPTLGQSTVEELLLALIRQHDEHSLDAVRWLRERHDEIKAGEQALAQAARIAFLEFLRRLDPAELEARFARAARDPRDPAGPRYWEQFTAFYRSLLGPADQLPRAFLESFAEAYKDTLRPNTLDMPGGTGAFRAPDKPR